MSRLVERHGNRRGIYVSEFVGTSILGYPNKDRANDPPTLVGGPFPMLDEAVLPQMDIYPTVRPR
jgi:hypothetical protein